MGLIWDTIELVAEDPIAVALGLAGDINFAGKILIGVSVWTWDSLSTLGTNSDGKREYTCGICNKLGHNRRTCKYRVTCDNCNNLEPDKIWKYDGVTVCNECV